MTIPPTSNSVVECGACGAPVERRVAHDVNGQTLCGACYSAAGATTRQAEADREAVRSRGAETLQDGKMFACVVLGVLCLMVGFWYLFNPVLPDTPSYLDGIAGEIASRTVNMQRLYLGQTFAIIGAIFLAMGIRPVR